MGHLGNKEGSPKSRRDLLAEVPGAGASRRGGRGADQAEGPAQARAPGTE